MNDRLGRFGKTELLSATTVCTLIFGCFSTDETDAYAHGNQLHFATLLALLLTLLVFEYALHCLEKSGCRSLGKLLSGQRFGSLFSVLIACSLFLAAVLPGVRFVRAMTGFIYTDAEPERIILYCLPCIILLAVLGMETLARTGRILLPITLLVTLVGLGSDVPLYRIYRLFPIYTSTVTLIEQTTVSLLRFMPVVWILLIAAGGAQGIQNVRFAGRWGLLIGGTVTLAAEVCVALSYRYTELMKLSAPLYRLMIEIDTDNAAVRLDRVVLFAWTMAAMFASSMSVYAASLLLIETFRVRDVRPIGVLLAACVGTAVAVFRGAEALAVPALYWAHRIGAVACTLPVLTLWQPLKLRLKDG